MPRRKNKNTSKRLIFKNSPSAVGTQYIKQGHLNKVLRGSGFLTNAIKKIKKVGKKAIKSNLTKKLLMAAKNQLKNKKTRKMIINTASNALDKIDNVSHLPPAAIKNRRREQKKVMDKIVQSLVNKGYGI